MTLVEMSSRDTNFLLKTTKKTLTQKEVRKIGSPFPIAYSKESWHVSPERIKKIAQKQGISSREYNAYTERVDDTVSPIQARIQLYRIQKNLAREEEQGSNERALDGLWKLAGYE